MSSLRTESFLASASAVILRASRITPLAEGDGFTIVTWGLPGGFWGSMDLHPASDRIARSVKSRAGG